MRVAAVGLLVSALFLSLANAALAHSFTVVLAIPKSGPTERDGKHAFDGFILAAQERDGHPDNKADGHLGGLDVYVHTADSQDLELAEMKAILKASSIDFIVLSTMEQERADAIASLAGSNAIVVTPGRLPYPFEPRTETTENVVPLNDFLSAFHEQYGYDATEWSARGYNAARRIDDAIRPLDSVDDKIELRKRLARTAREFTW